MNGKHSDPEPEVRQARDANGRVFGWVSGLGLLVVPWFVAGILATAGTMVGPSSWDAERTFPWFLLGTFVLGLVWVVIGSLRISNFARGAIPGTAISLGVTGAIYVIGLIVQG
jgi:hypothetical protein